MTDNEQNIIINAVSKSLNIEFRALLNNFVIHIGTLVNSEPCFYNTLVCVSLKYPYLDIMHDDEYIEEPFECMKCVAEFRREVGFSISKITDFILKSYLDLLDF